jgi:TPR repeat protein
MVMMSAFGPEADIKISYVLELQSAKRGLNDKFLPIEGSGMRKSVFNAFSILLLAATFVAQAGEKKVLEAFKDENWPVVRSEVEKLANEGNAWGLYMKASILGGILCIQPKEPGPCKQIPGYQRNDQEAGKYLLAAAQKGEKQAFRFVSLGYEKGYWGLPVDRDAAIAWSLKGFHLMNEPSIDQYKSLSGIQAGTVPPSAYAGSVRKQ